MLGVSKFVDTGQNYAMCKSQANDLLIMKKLVKYVIIQESVLVAVKAEPDYEEKAAEAMAYLRATISKGVIRKYLQEESPNVFWEKLKERYDKVDTQR
jgi:hypothetical protein